jgi:hypothetical protein
VVASGVRRHSKTTPLPLSLPLKVKLAEVRMLGLAGADSITVSGEVVSLGAAGPPVQVTL